MKKKLKLNDVRVSSFVTNLENDQKSSVKGGSGKCAPTVEKCFTGYYPTIDYDCTPTNIPHNCPGVAVSGGKICN